LVPTCTSQDTPKNAWHGRTSCGPQIERGSESLSLGAAHANLPLTGAHTAVHEAALDSKRVADTGPFCAGQTIQARQMETVALEAPQFRKIPAGAVITSKSFIANAMPRRTTKPPSKAYLIRSLDYIPLDRCP